MKIYIKDYEILPQKIFSNTLQLYSTIYPCQNTCESVRICNDYNNYLKRVNLIAIFSNCNRYTI